MKQFFQLPSLAVALRFCTRNTESCQVLTGPLGGGCWCVMFSLGKNEKVNGLEDETSFGMAYFQEFLLN